MSAAQHDFNIEQGSSFTLSIIYKDSNGTPIDISNWCARITWKTNTNTINSFSSLNVDYSQYKFTLGGATGEIKLQFPATTTNSFDFTNAKYDLELQSDDDLYSGGGKKTYRILYGTITIIKRFSKSTDLLECN